MKRNLICVIFTFMVIAGISIVCATENISTKQISNKLFSIQMPIETNGMYKVKKFRNNILIYDIASAKAGFGGFVFGIGAYKSPESHAMAPGCKKIGELVDKKGDIYDIVISHPTDVQYDYVKGESDSYKKLYDISSDIENKIKGKNGANYYYKQGTKGEDLYKEVLQKHITAIKEKWDSSKLEQENMSYMYNVIASNNQNALEKTGYIYYDTNDDGIDELFIGEIAEGDWKGVIYDIYTMVNRKPAHVISGGTRNRYYACNTIFICNEYSGGAAESGQLVYILVENSTELFPQVGFKYDGYTNKTKPWFISYNFSQNEWDNVSEELYNERWATFNKYKRFDYIPFSKVK